MRISHRSRLTELERRAAQVAPAETTGSGKEWTFDDYMRRVCGALRHNQLQFDRPGHVVANSWWSTSADYDFLQWMANWLNEGFAEQPGAVLCPLMPEQVEQGLRALDAGLIGPPPHWFGTCHSSRHDGICDRCRGTYLDGFCYGLGERFALFGLIGGLRDALKVVNAQAPGMLEENLEGLRKLLEWQREEHKKWQTQQPV